MLRCSVLQRMLRSFVPSFKHGKLYSTLQIHGSHEDHGHIKYLTMFQGLTITRQTCLVKNEDLGLIFSI